MCGGVGEWGVGKEWGMENQNFVNKTGFYPVSRGRKFYPIGMDPVSEGN